MIFDEFSIKTLIAYVPNRFGTTSPAVQSPGCTRMVAFVPTVRYWRYVELTSDHIGHGCAWFHRSVKCRCKLNNWCCFANRLPAYACLLLRQTARSVLSELSNRIRQYWLEVHAGKPLS